MKRRLLLLAGGLVVTVGSLAAYQFATSGDIQVFRPHSGGGSAMERPDPNGPDNPVAGWTVIIRTDPETNRPLYRIRVRDWKKQEGDRYLLTEPVAEFYLRNGRRILVRADRGEGVAREVARTLDLKRGRLEGNVRAYFFRSPVSKNVDDANAIDGVLQAHLDSIDFDNEALTLDSDGPVHLFSDDVDVRGRGLTIRYNEAPRELALLRLAQGDRLRLLNAPTGLGAFGLARDGQAGPDDPNAQTSDGFDQTQDGHAPEATTDQQDATDETREAQNRYVATFSQNVRVVSEDGSMTGADTLSLVFEMGKGWAGSDSSSETDQAGGNGEADTSRDDTRQGVGEDASKPASPQDPNTQIVDILWSGPLEIVPKGYVQQPKRGRYTIIASGDQLKLDSKEIRAVCESLHYRTPQEVGFLSGSRTAPVRLSLPDGQDVTCRTITFDQSKNEIYLSGPGVMRQLRVADANAATASTDDPNAYDVIAWEGRVQAYFEELSSGDSGSEASSRVHIKRAVFEDGVRFRRAGSTDYVLCDKLDVRMARTAEGKTYATRAIAEGNVEARQGSDEILAGEMDLTFAPADESTDSGDEGGKVSRMEARQDVRIKSFRDDPNLPVVIRCDSLDADRMRNTALLEGKPAEVLQGSQKITGRTIRVDQGDPEKGDETMRVEGEGLLRFLVDRDASGGKLDQPRLVKIEWKEGMVFQSDGLKADFNRDVVLTTGTDELKCRTMTAEFLEPNEPAEGHQRDSKDRNGLGMDIRMYRNLRLKTVTARKDVSLKGERENEKGKLLRRLTLLTPEDVVYHAADRSARVKGSGRLLIEDYSPPSRSKSGENTRDEGYLVSPSWTAFQWSESMSLQEEDLTVTMTGDVGMVHRSGDQVVLSDDLDLAFDKDKLPDGRKTVLGCDQLVAVFSRANANSADPNQAGVDKAIGLEEDFSGRLERLEALRDVTLRDGSARVEDCQRMLYDRADDIVRLDGYLPEKGQKPSNVSLRYEDRKSGAIRKVLAPQVIWHPRAKTARAINVSGTGGI
jgi:lipopolysaccharide export system protein LptA